MRRHWIAVVVVLAGMSVGCEQWNKMWGKDNKDTDVAKEERTSMTALPQPVQDAFKKDFPNATVEKINRETEKDGAVHYEFKFKDQSGREQEVEYNGDGTRAQEAK